MIPPELLWDNHSTKLISNPIVRSHSHLWFCSPRTLLKQTVSFRLGHR